MAAGKGLRTGAGACRGCSAAPVPEAPPVYPLGSRLCPTQAPGWGDPVWGLGSQEGGPAPEAWITVARASAQAWCRRGHGPGPRPQTVD